MVETKKQREDREKREELEREKVAAERKAAAAKNGPPKPPEAQKTPAAGSQQFVTFDQFQVVSNDMQQMQNEMQQLQIAVADNSNNSQKFQTEISDLKTEIQNATQTLQNATQTQATVVNALNTKFDQIMSSLNAMQTPQQVAPAPANAPPPAAPTTQPQMANLSSTVVTTSAQVQTPAAPPVAVSTLTAGGGLTTLSQHAGTTPTLVSSTASSRVVLVTDPFASVQAYNGVRTQGNFADWHKEEFLPAAKLSGMSDTDVLCRLRNSLGPVCKSQYDLVLRDHPDDLPTMVSELSKEFRHREKLGMDTLYERKMLADETVQQYAIELQKLFFKIKPAADHAEAEKTLAPVFRKGIPQTLLKYSRVYPYPDKLSEIVKLVKHYEPEWRDERGLAGSVGVNALGSPQILHRSTSNSALYNSNNNYGRSDQNRQMGGDQHSFNRGQTNQRGSSFTGNCYNCGEPGHISRDCPNRGRENGFRGNLRDNYGSRSFTNSYGNQGNRGGFAPRGGFSQNENRGQRSPNRGGRNSHFSNPNSYSPNNSRRRSNSPSNRGADCQLCGRPGHIARFCHSYTDLMSNFTTAVANLRVPAMPMAPAMQQAQLSAPPPAPSPFSIPLPTAPSAGHFAATNAQTSAGPNRHA